MDRRAALLWALGALAEGCGGIQSYEPDDADAGVASAHVAGRTEIVILGTLHATHLSSRGYSLETIEQFVRAVDPDVVFVEIPPDLFEAAVADADRVGPDAPSSSVADPWLRDFPELYRVVLPLRHDLDYALEPVSGWTPQAGADHDAYFDRFPAGPEAREYALMAQRFNAALVNNNSRENPEWVNGPEYLDLCTDARRWLSYYAEEALGEAGEMRLNARHAALIDAAIDRHAGERILIVFGALQRYFIEPSVEARGDVTLLAATDFLP